MKKTKIYNVLAHFDKYEQNRLRKFLLSPYFNSDESIVLLFDLIIKYLNGSRKKELQKEKLWEKLTGKKGFDDIRFRKYCSDLLKNVESFLAIELIENDKITKTHLTLSSIKNRKVEGLYKSFIKNSRELANKNIDQSSNYHLNQYLIEKNLYELTESELKRMNKSNIDFISSSLDNFYFSEKLRFYSAALSQQAYLKEPYNINFADELVEMVPNSALLEVPSVAIYYYSMLTVKEYEDENHYFKLKQLLSEVVKDFPKNEAISLYYFVINYCIRKYNRGDWKFAQEVFDIYSETVEKEIIFNDQGEISPWDFKNIITFGLFLSKYDWIENFITQCGPRIPVQYRENSIKFNLGQLLFRQKKYEKALDQLRDLEYDDILASLHAKTYTIYCYYELDSIEFLMSYIESFRVYLGRKKEIKDRQRRYLNFLSMVKKLTKVMPRDKKAIEKIERDFEEIQKQGIVGAKWLTEKIAELK